MNLRIAIYVSFACLSVTGTAWGQSTIPQGKDIVIGYQGIPSRTPGNVESGLQLSDSALLHVGIGAEAGYDSNVFYSDANAKGSAITRIIPFLELTNAARGGVIPSGVFFDLGAALTYREYISSDPLIRDQRAFMPNAYGSLEFGRSQNLGFGLADTFARIEEPPYLNVPNQQQPIARDVNQALATVRWAPGGGRLAAVLSYANTVDVFETQSLRIANSMVNVLMLDTSWKWLPKTAVVLQISQGYSTYFDTDATGASKPTSFPFHVMTGLRGLITAKLALNLTVGYMNGFYDLPTGRPGPSGFQGNFSALADVSYRPTLLTAINLGYRRDLNNAILGDFYYLDAVYLNVGQAIAGRLGLGASVRYESRSFQNIRLPSSGALINRHDNYWQAGANLDYHIRDWTYAGVAYTVLSNGSDYEPLAAQDPGRVNYVKQVVFARLGLTY